MPPAPLLTEKEEQRFYARNSLNTTLPGHVGEMLSVWANSRTPQSAKTNERAPTNCADQLGGTIVRLSAYVGGVALLAILAAYFWNGLPRLEAAAAVDGTGGWSETGRTYPAFAASLLNHVVQTNTYTVLRHAQLGRKDILRWIGDDGGVVAALEVYRPGERFDEKATTSVPVPPARPVEAFEPESAGIIESKFGYVALTRRSNSANSAAPCLGFVKRFEDAGLQISGWTCQAGSVPEQRVAIACMLDRLVLLASGNDLKLAELFARAELKRKGCAPSIGPADWMTEAANPRLRGPL
jgi:hypothetical protein